MSGPDLENTQPENAQGVPSRFRWSEWLKSSRRHRLDEAGAKSINSSGLQPGARHDQMSNTTETPAKSWVSLKNRFVLRKVKLEADDGYTTHSFNRIQRPIPVEDIFFNARVLIFLRLIIRGGILVCSGATYYNSLNLPVLWVLVPVFYVLQRNKIHGFGGIPIPTVQQLLSFTQYPQRFWEIFGAKVFLKPRTASLWWLVYLLVARAADFEKNFLNAWSLLPPPSAQDGVTGLTTGTADSHDDNQASVSRAVDAGSGRLVSAHPSGQRHGGSSQQAMANGNIEKRPGWLLVFLANEHLQIPLLSGSLKDKEIFKRLRMFYRYLKTKRGLLELVIPRRLVRINCVQVEKDGRLAGLITGTFDCGRGLQYFRSPATSRDSTAAALRAEQLAAAEPHEALEYVRSLDRGAIGAVIMAPSLASLVFIVVWLSVYLRKTKENKGEPDVQVVVTTAFTIAIYLVTAGALITGLVAYLDSDQLESESSSSSTEKSSSLKKSSVEENSPGSG